MRGALNALLLVTATSPLAHGDDVLHRYEADVPAYDAITGWIGSPCQHICSDVTKGSHFIITWPEANEPKSYGYIIAPAGMPPPPSLWAEWRFRSNHPIPTFSYTCDALFSVVYKEIVDYVFMYGDATISSSGDDFVFGLNIEEFHTYRFESVDGFHYAFSVDGQVFLSGEGFGGSGLNNGLQMHGDGGCADDQIPNMVNEWDYVRFGTIDYGEQIVSSNPPQGFIDARVHPSLDRFTVTYDSANYVYIDEITLESEPQAQARGNPPWSPLARGTGPSLALWVPITPTVIATRRLDNGEPDTVEVVLDEPIPYNATTRFTFNDGVATSIVEFTYAPGDTNGDGQATLADFAAFQNCFGTSSAQGVCLVLDSNTDDHITASDFTAFLSAMNP